LSAKNVASLSLMGGLSLSCILAGYPNAELVLGYQQKRDDFYSYRMAKHNIKRVYKKELKLHTSQMFEVNFQKDFNLNKWI
jgi:hypothetical protein